MECVFCEIVKNHRPEDVIYEDDDIIVIPDKYPVTKGHMLVIPKKHYRNLLEVDDHVLSKLIIITKKVAIAAMKALDAKGVNILSNIERVAGQVIMHTHIHVIPRYYDDDFGFHWSRVSLTEEEKVLIVKKIREKLP